MTHPDTGYLHADDGWRNPPNPWGRISEIAARLGVPPYDDKGGPTLCALGADGKRYDIWAVVAAALDVVEAALK